MLAPLIRSFMLGVVWLNSQDVAISEQLQERPPHVATNPFFMYGAINNYREGEFSQTVNGHTYCQWIVAAVSQSGGPIYVDINPDAHVGLIQETSYPPFKQINIWNPVVNPCDINIDGSTNIFDFITFLNNPYDWNGDMSLDIFDFIDFLNNCGG